MISKILLKRMLMISKMAKGIGMDMAADRELECVCNSNA